MAGAFEKWAEQAAKQIRYRPDREAVQKELSDHMEDRKADFLEEMGEAEAETAVLHAMGDAKAVGQALNRVHDPWVSYAWRISGIVAVVLVVITGLALLFHLHDDVSRSRMVWRRQESDYCGDPVEERIPVTGELVFEEEPYTIRLDHGSLEKSDCWQRLVLGLEAHGFEPWLQYPAGLNNITVEDSFGNVYTGTVDEVEGAGTCLTHVSIVQAWELPWWRIHLVVEYLPSDLENGEYPQWQRITVDHTDIDFTVWHSGEVRKNP